MSINEARRPLFVVAPAPSFFTISRFSFRRGIRDKKRRGKRKMRRSTTSATGDLTTPSNFDRIAREAREAADDEEETGELKDESVITSSSWYERECEGATYSLNFSERASLQKSGFSLSRNEKLHSFGVTAHSKEFRRAKLHAHIRERKSTKSNILNENASLAL